MNSQDFNTNLKNRTKKVATFFKSRDVVTFLLFLLLASVLWILHSSSTKHEMRSNAIVQYVGVPAEVVLDKELPNKISFTLCDDDKPIWNYISFSLDTITIDVATYFATNERNIEISYDRDLRLAVSKFSPTAKITDISPNIFSTTYSRLVSKGVGVKLANEIKLNSQLMLTDSIHIVPDKITVIGKKEVVDSIDVIYTAPITEEVTQSKSIRAEIVLPKGVKSNNKMVSIVVATEASTEKRMTLPISAINVPEGKRLRTFPSEAEVVFNVGLSNYNNITNDDITIVVDYSDEICNGTSVLPLQATMLPSGIQRLRIIPKEVEYIIENED